MGNRIVNVDFDELAPQGMIVPSDPPTADEAAAREPIELPIQNFESMDSLWFERVAVIPLPALGVTARVVSFSMPPGYTGVVRAFSNVFLGAGFKDGSVDIIWRILRDAQAVEDYESITWQNGSMPVGKQTFIIVGENQTIEITVTTVVVPGGGIDIGARLEGYRWPTTRRIR